MKFAHDDSLDHVRTSVGTRLDDMDLPSFPTDYDQKKRCATIFPPKTEFKDVKTRVSHTLEPNNQRQFGANFEQPSCSTSKFTTMAGERGASGSRNASLSVASYHSLPIFCVRLKHFEMNLFIGSAMGRTR